MALRKNSPYKSHWSHSIEQEFDSIGTSFKNGGNSYTIQTIEKEDTMSRISHYPSSIIEKERFTPGPRYLESQYSTNKQPFLSYLPNKNPLHSYRGSLYTHLPKTYNSNEKMDNSLESTQNKTLQHFLGISSPAFEINKRTSSNNRTNFLSNTTLEELNNKFGSYSQSLESKLESHFSLAHQITNSKNLSYNERPIYSKFSYNSPANVISSQSGHKSQMNLLHSHSKDPVTLNSQNFDPINSSFKSHFKSSEKQKHLQIDDHFDDIQSSNFDHTDLKEKIIQNANTRNSKFNFSNSITPSMDPIQTIRSLQNENTKLRRNYNNISHSHENNIDQLSLLKSKITHLQNELNRANNEITVRNTTIERLEKRLFLFESSKMLSSDNNFNSPVPLKGVYKTPDEYNFPALPPPAHLPSEFISPSTALNLQSKTENSSRFSKLKSLFESARNHEKYLDTIISQKKTDEIPKSKPKLNPGTTSQPSSKTSALTKEAYDKSTNSLNHKELSSSNTLFTTTDLPETNYSDTLESNPFQESTSNLNRNKSPLKYTFSESSAIVSNSQPTFVNRYSPTITYKDSPSLTKIDTLTPNDPIDKTTIKSTSKSDDLFDPFALEDSTKNPSFDENYFQDFSHDISENFKTKETPLPLDTNNSNLYSTSPKFENAKFKIIDASLPPKDWLPDSYKFDEVSEKDSTFANNCTNDIHKSTIST